MDTLLLITITDTLEHVDSENIKLVYKMWLKLAKTGKNRIFRFFLKKSYSLLYSF
jgi:hypothetical protein